ncbi:hypothetical protein EJ06DRAFT_534128 [Trichodelitschia bisporula]|uniref:Uncharacterized protein n=1 Tax=Trichodelitschia bisporula TaxID=703511 RepID=A0A6G1HKV8_9PEZI|nr:hypothetical protein EJ06DRAFT_534128 [Trichodelitschia bisporula]
MAEDREGSAPMDIAMADAESDSDETIIFLAEVADDPEPTAMPTTEVASGSGDTIIPTTEVESGADSTVSPMTEVASSPDTSATKETGQRKSDDIKLSVSKGVQAPITMASELVREAPSFDINSTPSSRLVANKVRTSDHRRILGFLLSLSSQCGAGHRTHAWSSYQKESR